MPPTSSQRQPTHYICETCGVQYPATEVPPARCVICDEPRQYVPAEGQMWTSMTELSADHENRVEEVEPNLYGVWTEPRFAIGQRALLVLTPAGNVLWDCVSLLDEPTKRAVGALGGIAAIAVCHPHYYSSMVEWARAFDCDVHLHRADERWVVRPDERVTFFDDETLSLPGGLTLIRTGGHFAGSTALHWPAGADGRGVLLSGDSLKTTADLKHVSFVRSSPNDLPLSADDADDVVARLEPFAYDRLYSFRHDMVLLTGAKDVVRDSAQRHREALAGRYPGGTALSNELPDDDFDPADHPLQTPPSTVPHVTLSNPPGLADPTRYAFSQVGEVPAGAKLIYTAGIGGGFPDGRHADDFVTEVRQCLANLRTALGSAGGSMAEVAKITILVVAFDAERHATLTAALREAFPAGRYPASTLIPVARLAGEAMQVEIEAVGVVVG